MRNRWMRWTAAGGACAGIVAAGAATVWYTEGDAQGRAVADTSASMRISAADAGDASRYWTANRMAAATPIDRPTGGGIHETQAPMERLRDRLTASPPSAFDVYGGGSPPVRSGS